MCTVFHLQTIRKLNILTDLFFYLFILYILKNCNIYNYRFIIYMIYELCET